MTIGSVAGSFRRLRSELGGLFAVSCFLNLLALTSSIYMLQVFDRVLTSQSYDTLLYLTLIAIVATGLMALLEVVRKRVLVRMGYWFEATAAPPVLRAASRSRLDGQRPGATLKDIADIRQFVSGDGITAFFDAPWMPIFLAFLFLLDSLLGIIAVLGAAALFGCALANDKLTRRSAEDLRASSARVDEAARELETNSELIRALGMTDTAFARWHARVWQRVPLAVSAIDLGGTISGISRGLRMGLQVLIMAAGAYLVLEQQITAGGMIAASIILARALAPVEKSIQGWRGFTDARQAYGNLRGVADMTDEASATPLPAPQGKLDLENVRFNPPGSDDPIIRNVSFSLEPGEAIGVFGPSGSGKSTLCRILVGTIAPGFGHARLDGADIFEHIDQLGAHIGYVPQEVSFLAGSVAENISRFAEPGEAVAKATVEAAQRAGVHELVLSLPKQYETDLGTFGVRLSGGQRQRIALARALYGKPKLLVLDEPNSNLDGQGQHALMSAMAEARMAGTTIVVVTHQPAFLRDCNRMIVLQNGLVVHQGPPEAVMAELRARTAEAAQRTDDTQAPVTEAS